MIPGANAALLRGINITIRKAKLTDAPVIAEYNRRLAEETEDLHLDPDRLLAGVSALLGDPAKGLYFVAEIGGAVAGQLMITYEWSDWRNGTIWWIQSVYVGRDYRQRGVFSALFAYVEDLARATPEVWGVRLYMHSQNASAQRAYERLGMTRTEYVVFEKGLREEGES